MPDFDPRWDGASIPENHWHFHRRLHERYGITMAPGDFGAMVRDIETGRALMVHKHTRKRRVYWCRLKSCYERVYVLANGDMILTAWPATREIVALRKQAQARYEAERQRKAAEAATSALP